MVGEITKMGYDCRWCVISAASVGALHRRERWFLLAHSKSERSHARGFTLRKEEKQPFFTSKSEYVIRYKEPENKLEVAGMANDVPYRMDRTRALGNSVVPAQAKEAFEILMGIKEEGAE